MSSRENGFIGAFSPKLIAYTSLFIYNVASNKKYRCTSNLFLWLEKPN